MKINQLTVSYVMDRMGTEATAAQAERMIEILKQRYGRDYDFDDLMDSEFFALIPECIQAL